MHESLRQFHPVIGKWFEERVGIPTPPQMLGWPVIGALKSGLILAPTGSGKTLAAFLAAIDWVARWLMAAQAEDKSLWGVQILYVSPLKALANDVQKNLLRPLEEIAEVAAAVKVEWPEVMVGVRTGDTPAKERAGMLRRPPHILITTPESLNLMLMSAARGMLGTVKFVIVDEVHALAGSKRGVFLSLILERLEEERHKHERAKVRSGTKKIQKGMKIAPGVYVPVEEVGPLIRIGLSATARPEEGIARWLAGIDDEGNARAIEVVKSGQRKKLDLGVVCPFGGEEEEMAAARARAEGKEVVKGTGHWPEVTRAILAMIRAHKSTLVFGNSRRLIERLAARFQEELEREAGVSAGELDTSGNQISKIENRKSPVILPHHGSIAKEVRLETEMALKRGEVDAVLATSSLELGIDIGALDLVVQIDSPGNVAAGLQRVGRAGHLEKATAKGRFIARGMYELPSFAALVPLMFEGVVEETRIPENCLDVLAQQIVSACVTRPWKRGALFKVFRRAMPFHALTEKQFDSVVGMLSKRTERVTAQGLRPRVSFDRVNDELIILPGAAQVVMTNSGVIADTGQFPVYLAGATKGRVELGGAGGAPREAAQARWGGRDSGSQNSDFKGVRIGELDEEFVYETKEGDRIVLGSQTWRVIRIDADRVIVEHAEPGSSRMPFWRGENAPRSDMLGEAVAKFHGEMVGRLEKGERPGNETTNDVAQWLMAAHHFDERAAENAVGFYQRQMRKGAVPAWGSVVVEHFTDRTGEPIVAILLPLGSRVNYALRLALEGQFARRRLPAQVVHHDDGLIIRPPVEVGEIPENPLAWLKSRTLEQEIIDQLEGSALFGMRFRQNAARALMLPRMTLTQRTPLWQQRLRARHLLALVKQQRNFPVMVETYREVLQDVLNIPRVVELLRHLEGGEWQVRLVKQAAGELSPFARSLFSQFQQAYLYEWDDPLATQTAEPAVDQRVIDEILQRRGGEEAGVKTAAIAWDPADEEALRRRIFGADYPARTAEELLEKIEAAGAAGVALALDDPAWEQWAVGGAAEARHMLRELSRKRRVLWMEGKGEAVRWVGVENLALLIAARGKEGLKRVKFFVLEGEGRVEVKWGELPAALLETTLHESEARRLVVEQMVKQSAVAERAAVIAALPWVKGAEGMVAEMIRAGAVLELEGGRIIWAEYAEQLRGMALRRQRRMAATVDVAALQRHLLRWQGIDRNDERRPAKSDTVAIDETHALDQAEDALDLLTGLAFPLEVWEHDVLALRVKGFAPAILEGMCAGGHRVWVGQRGGGQDIDVAFWPRHLVGTRPAPVAIEGAALSEQAAAVREFLRANGASFFFDVRIGMGGAGVDEGALALALRELAGAGEVSNDQLESLRQVLRLAENAARDRARRPAAPRLHATHALHTPRPARMPRNWWKTGGGVGRGTRGGVTAGSLGGRWFLLPAPRPPAGENAMELAEQAADRVERFLRRDGFACRELLEPAIDGSWRDAYDVLTRMEWAGTVRRGYFVDGIAGSQFAVPQARLDAPDGAGGSADGDVVWLAMLDPANVWARVATRWISDAGLAARVPRVAGSWVALVEGRPVLAAVAWGQRLIPLPAGEEEQRLALAQVAQLLERLPRNGGSGHGYLAVKWWGEQDVMGTWVEETLRRQGFVREVQGMRLYRKYGS